MSLSTLSQRAEALAMQGEVAAAHALLSQGDARGDPDATFVLAAWYFTGRFLPRDLALSRRLFARAANAGRSDAGAISIAFLANGTGGTREWKHALRLLQRRAQRDPDASRQLEVISAMQLTAEGDPVSLPEPEMLSESPRITLFRNLLSAAECRFLIDAATPLLTPSKVIHPVSGALVQDLIRSSDATAFPLATENPAIHALNRRLARASGTAVAQGEPLQVLRYRPGQEYKLHSDALPVAGNQRVQTMLVYLNCDYTGGATCFPEVKLQIRGQIGDALLFWNVDSHGRPDPRANHAGAPVLQGEKLLASRWIRQRPLDLEDAPADTATR